MKIEFSPESDGDLKKAAADLEASGAESIEIPNCFGARLIKPDTEEARKALDASSKKTVFSENVEIDGRAYIVAAS